MHSFSWFLSFLLPGACIAATVGFAEYEIPSIPYHVLSQREPLASDMLESLATSGMIAISSIPELENVKRSVLLSSPHCGRRSSRVTNFADGTNRKTFAGSVDNGVHSELGVEANCKAMFDQFRSIVSSAVDRFATKLDEVYKASSSFIRAPEKTYSNFTEVVHGGQHLEHFHEYYRMDPSTATKEPTIEMHIDQGLFIAFTTPLMSGESDDIGDFWIQNSAGVYLRPKLIGQHDSVIIMMGDGVNQYINSKLQSEHKMFATPHAFMMPQNTEESRLWYGRMVLPPADGLSPSGVSFQELREGLINDPASEDYMSMGCAGERVARELTTVCAEDALFCWNRCMNYTAIGMFYNDEPLSEEYCQEQGYKYMTCINTALDTVYNSSGCNDGTFSSSDACPNKHGSFSPGCTNSTSPDIARASLSPQGSSCTDADFQTVVDSELYDFKKVYNDEFIVQVKKNLTPDREELCFRLLFNGIAGWMSAGFYNSAGTQRRFTTDTGEVYYDTNYMMGANVVMGIFNDPDYPFEVHEYTIHPSVTQFQVPTAPAIIDHLAPPDQPRGWGVPLVEESIQNQSMLQNDCYSEMKFCTDGIGDEKFKMVGVNNFMWGYEKRRQVVSKHSDDTRGFEQIDFFSGGAKSGGSPVYATLVLALLTTAFFSNSRCF